MEGSELVDEGDSDEAVCLGTERGCGEVDDDILEDAGEEVDEEFVDDGDELK